jgi:UDP-2,3-diacylglucosamine hydrolase
MAHSLLISDLHLCESRPQIAAAFLRFLVDTCPAAEALYILGDLFESWVGDDSAGQPFARQVTHALAVLAGQGVAVYLMHGNRDFLMGQELAAACRGRLLPDPTLVDFYGTPTLLMHGDTLCTDDQEYLGFREVVRNPAWQATFLAQPLETRLETAAQMRRQSESRKQEKQPDIMDVNEQAVAAVLRAHGYPRLIHGHTHRPAQHRHLVDGHPCERWVLPEWYEAGGYLRVDRQGARFCPV